MSSLVDMNALARLVTDTVRTVCLMGDVSDLAYQLLRASLDPGEVEVAFGRAETRGGEWILVSNTHLRWGYPSASERLGSLPLSKITFSEQMTRYHRWGVALQHERIDQVVHVPAHRLFWWSWGNDWAVRAFEETTVWFSRRETTAAVRCGAHRWRSVLGSEDPTPDPSSWRARDSQVFSTRAFPATARRAHAIRPVAEPPLPWSLAWRVRIPGWLLFSVPLVFINRGSRC